MEVTGGLSFNRFGGVLGAGRRQPEVDWRVSLR